MSVLPPELVVLHENVHKRVFMTYLRMSTHKESKVRLLNKENSFILTQQTAVVCLYSIRLSGGAEGYWTITLISHCFKIFWKGLTFIL